MVKVQPMEHLPDHCYCVILAGGSGTRFWPKSRHLMPKQLCKIGSKDMTMLELTIERLEGFVPPQRRIIVTHKDQFVATQNLVGDSVAHIIAEPEARNTAAALTLAALVIKDLHTSKVTAGNKAPIMLSIHADHVIRDPEGFRTVLQKAITTAEQDYLTLVGIVPQSPETGFGYIECGPAIGSANTQAKQVTSFREKPPRKVAEEYVASGRFLWNAGYFIWKIDVLLAALQKHLPKTLAGIKTGLGASPKMCINRAPTPELAAAYGQVNKDSIDQGLIEKSERIAVIPADIGWQDVGSWDALGSTFGTDENKNYVSGDALFIDAKNMTVDTDGTLVACLGVNDLIVVKSGNAILVCPKDRAQDVKLIVEELKAQGRKDLV